MVRMIHGNLPYFYNAILRPLEINHHYRTRNNIYRHPFVANEVQKRSITHQIINLYENTPSEYIENRQVKSSIGKYKKYLLEIQ